MSNITYPHPDAWEAVFDDTTERALEIFRENACRAYTPLQYLEGATYPDVEALAMQGASYKSLAKIAHLMNLSEKQRQKWYTVAQEVYLSQAHAGTIIGRINETEDMMHGLNELLAEHS